MGNLDFYKRASKPPEWALKDIQAGRLKGKTDINPQWRYEAMTEIYGPCGFGWWFVHKDKWTEKGENELMCFVEIELFVKIDGEVSQPIPAIGGAKLIMAETRGPYNNDEGWKMARTDALGKAMQAIGIASEVYRGTRNTKYEFADALGVETMSESDKEIKDLLEKYSLDAKQLQNFLKSTGSKYSGLLESEKRKLASRIRENKGLEIMVEPLKNNPAKEVKKTTEQSIEDLEL